MCVPHAGALAPKEVPVPQGAREVVQVDRLVEVPIEVERIVTVERLVEKPTRAVHTELPRLAAVRAVVYVAAALCVAGAQPIPITIQCIRRAGSGDALASCGIAVSSRTAGLYERLRRGGRVTTIQRIFPTGPGSGFTHGRATLTFEADAVRIRAVDHLCEGKAVFRAQCCLGRPFAAPGTW